MVSHISSPAMPSRPAVETDRLRAGARAAAPAPAVPPGDSVLLSVAAGTLPAGLAGGPPVDAALVDRIGTAIAGGRYPVDPDRIAEAMFADQAGFRGN